MGTGGLQWQYPAVSFPVCQNSQFRHVLSELLPFLFPCSLTLFPRLNYCTDNLCNHQAKCSQAAFASRIYLSRVSPLSWGLLETAAQIMALIRSQEAVQSTPG